MSSAAARASAGRKVLVTGAADLRLAGQDVDILLDGKRVGKTTIGPDGLFSLRVAAPAKKRRHRARHEARAGAAASQKLKLERRMLATKKVFPNRGGSFAVRIPVPAGTKAAIYRALTRVAVEPGGPAKAPTFTLPRAIDL